MRSNAADRPEVVVRTKSHRLVHLCGQGKISYVGSSNFAAWDVALTNFTGVRCVSCAVRVVGIGRGEVPVRVEGSVRGEL
ncbi:MAG TPA: hypothetical protein VF086_08420 [Propionibacteriaceae bacterium]